MIILNYWLSVMKDEKLEWCWALVGNIVDKHEYGENHEIRYGTRKFRGSGIIRRSLIKKSLKKAD